MDEWGLSADAPSSTLDAFKSQIVKSMADLCKNFGGPLQYLMHLYDTKEKREEFGKMLYKEFPFEAGVNYHITENVPVSSATNHVPLVMHMSVFNLTSSASLKMAPGATLAMQLTNEIVTDGCVTIGDPLRVWVMAKNDWVPAPWQVKTVVDQVVTYSPEDALGCNSIGYIKGMARTSTLLAILSLCLEDKVTGSDILKVGGSHSKLQTTLKTCTGLCSYFAS
jgi:hypothetical protein